MALPDPINIGTAPNNGTGDPLRTAFQKSNAREDYLDANKQDISEKGVANGYPPLDANTLIPEQYIPFDSVLAQKVQVSTGLLNGLTLTINADNTKFDIAPGTGFVTDNTDPLDPITTKVTYAGSTANIVTNLATEPVTYIGLDSTGTIVQKGEPFTNEESRDYIVIGALVHSNNTNITLVNSISNYIVSPTSQLHDLIRLFGIINDKGNRVTANGANLQLNKSQGTIFKLGLNPGTKNPHERVLPALGPVSFRYRLSNGTEFTDTTNVNPSQYESGGSLVSVPSNNYSIQRIALFQSNNVRLQYAQQTYATLDAAAAALATENYILESNIAENGILIGFLIVKTGTISLQNSANAKFVATNRFGDISGGASSGTSFGYTPEDVANKAIDYTTINNTLYPTLQATENRYAKPADLPTNTSDLVNDGDNTTDPFIDRTDTFTDSEGGTVPPVLNEPSATVTNITSTGFDAVIGAATVRKKLTSEGWLDDVNTTRTRKEVTNTTQYTVIPEDFTDFELVFTGDTAGAEIDVIINTDVCPNTNPDTGLQIVSIADNVLNFTGTATLTPTAGSLPKTSNDGTSVSIAGLKPSSGVNDLGIFGTLQSDGSSDAVLLTSDQTIDGIKTFNSSPIVPTPTTDFQVATKEYADGAFSGQTLTGTEINLSNIAGNNYNYATPSTATTYTTVSPVVNGFARCFINASTEPTVTGATKVSGSLFEASTVMEMVIESPDGTAVEYYFISR